MVNCRIRKWFPRRIGIGHHHPLELTRLELRTYTAIQMKGIPCRQFLQPLWYSIMPRRKWKHRTVCSHHHRSMWPVFQTLGPMWPRWAHSTATTAWFSRWMRIWPAQLQSPPKHSLCGWHHNSRWPKIHWMCRWRSKRRLVIARSLFSMTLAKAAQLASKSR